MAHIKKRKTFAEIDEEKTAWKRANPPAAAANNVIPASPVKNDEALPLTPQVPLDAYVAAPPSLRACRSSKRLRMARALQSVGSITEAELGEHETFHASCAIAAGPPALAAIPGLPGWFAPAMAASLAPMQGQLNSMQGQLNNTLLKTVALFLSDLLAEPGSSSSSSANSPVRSCF